MFWIYEARGFPLKKRREMFERQYLKKRAGFLNDVFCLPPEFGKRINVPGRTMDKLHVLADRLEISYPLFWRMALQGYARAEGIGYLQLPNELSGSQLKLYIYEGWLHETPLNLYFSRWFRSSGYKGLSAQDTFHKWQLKRLTAQCSSGELSGRIATSVEAGCLPLDFLRGLIH